MKNLIFILLLAFVSSCGHTPSYKEKGVWDQTGFSEREKTKDSFEVSYVTADVDNLELGEALFVRRCAEITLREGYDWFVFYNKTSQVQVKTVSKRLETYGIIFLKKGPIESDGIDARSVMNKSLPNGVIQK